MDLTNNWITHTHTMMMNDTAAVMLMNDTNTTITTSPSIDQVLPVTNWTADWLTHHSKVGFFTLLSAIMLVACFGNMLVLAIAFKTPKMRTTNNCFIFNLACCDFLVGCFSIPLMLVTIYSDRWIFGMAMCQIALVIDNLIMMESIWTLAALSAFRALTVINPFRMKQHSVRKGVLVTLLILWLLAGCFVSTPLLGWGTYGFSEFTFNCGVGFGTFFVSFIVLVLFLPIFIVVVSYVIILYTLALSNSIKNRALRESRHFSSDRRTGTITALAKTSDVFASLPMEPNGTTTTSSDNVTKRGFRLCLKFKFFCSGPAKSSLRVLVIVGVFLLCIGPLLIIAFIMYITGDMGSVHMSQTTLFIVYIVSLSHSAINPCVYGLFDKRFRQEYRAIFRGSPLSHNDKIRSIRSAFPRTTYESTVPSPTLPASLKSAGPAAVRVPPPNYSSDNGTAATADNTACDQTVGQTSDAGSHE